MTWVQVLPNACHSQVVVGWPRCGAGAELLQSVGLPEREAVRAVAKGTGVRPSASAPKFCRLDTRA